MTESTDPHIPTGDGGFDFPGDPSGAGGTLNLNEVITIVTNIINQIPDTEAVLKALLTQLQQIILSTTELSTADKVSLLGAVRNLALAGQTSDSASKTELVRRAKTIIVTISQRSPSIANLTDIVNRLLPLSLSALGVPA